MLPVVLLPEADAELRAALARYEGVRPELGQRFAEAVIDCVERIAMGPLHFAVIEKGRRRAGIHRFPYGSISFLEEQHCGECLFPWAAKSKSPADSVGCPGVSSSCI
jgi:hypothetical protein